MTITSLGLSEIAQTLESDPGLPSRVLDLILRISGTTDQELADQLGRTRSSVQQKRKGTSRLRFAEFMPFAAALTECFKEQVGQSESVPPEIFVSSPKIANEWLFEHRPDLFGWCAA